MTVRVFGCSKFGRLLNEREDRELSAQEQQFMRRHRSACARCSREEAASNHSLNMLRAAAFEAAPRRGFDERILRRVRVNLVRDSIGYWSPALVGSAIACVALLVMLHLLVSPPGLGSASLPSGEARATTQHFPSLELNKLPPFGR